MRIIVVLRNVQTVIIYQHREASWKMIEIIDAFFEFMQNTNIPIGVPLCSFSVTKTIEAFRILIWHMPLSSPIFAISFVFMWSATFVTISCDL